MKHVIPYFIAFGLVVTLLLGCSMQQNTAKSRWWHAFNTRYNVYYNGSMAYIDGSLEKLPKQNVDTGMGFERLCMALQGKSSNYDTDVFTPLIEKVEELSGKKYTGKLDDEKDIAIRVIVDHIRAVSFAIADGQLPSNGGAGYVIRRILRRAIRYAFTFLGQKEPFIHKLVATLAQQMGGAFPELDKQYELIKNVIKEEETMSQSHKDLMKKVIEQFDIADVNVFSPDFDDAKLLRIDISKSNQNWIFHIHNPNIILFEKFQLFTELLRKNYERFGGAKAIITTEEDVFVNETLIQDYWAYILDAIKDESSVSHQILLGQTPKFVNNQIQIYLYLDIQTVDNKTPI